ncbi:MAG TPA: PadR family transcriptional regulator [Caulobacteraceae bacterium]
MDITPWLAQLRKGAAELTVLSVIADGGECYGLQILERANVGGDIVSDGALYPLLSRLEKEGKLSARWVLEEGPHPRKYYRLTDQGAALVPVMIQAWTDFRQAMTRIVEKTR